MNDCVFIPFDLLINNNISTGARVFYAYVKYFSKSCILGGFIYHIDYESLLSDLKISKRTFYNYCSELSKNGFIVYNPESITILED